MHIPAFRDGHVSCFAVDPTVSISTAEHVAEACSMSSENPYRVPSLMAKLYSAWPRGRHTDSRAACIQVLVLCGRPYDADAPRYHDTGVSKAVAYW